MAAARPSCDPSDSASISCSARIGSLEWTRTTSVPHQTSRFTTSSISLKSCPHLFCFWGCKLEWWLTALKRSLNFEERTSCKPVPDSVDSSAYSWLAESSSDTALSVSSISAPSRMRIWACSPSYRAWILVSLSSSLSHCYLSISSEDYDHLFWKCWAVNFVLVVCGLVRWISFAPRSSLRSSLSEWRDPWMVQTWWRVWARWSDCHVSFRRATIVDALKEAGPCFGMEHRGLISCAEVWCGCLLRRGTC